VQFHSCSLTSFKYTIYIWKYKARSEWSNLHLSVIFSVYYVNVSPIFFPSHSIHIWVKIWTNFNLTVGFLHFWPNVFYFYFIFRVCIWVYYAFSSSEMLRSSDMLSITTPLLLLTCTATMTSGPLLPSITVTQDFRLSLTHTHTHTHGPLVLLPLRGCGQLCQMLNGKMPSRSESKPAIWSHCFPSWNCSCTQKHERKPVDMRWDLLSLQDYNRNLFSGLVLRRSGGLV